MHMEGGVFAETFSIRRHPTHPDEVARDNQVGDGGGGQLSSVGRRDIWD